MDEERLNIVETQLKLRRRKENTAALWADQFGDELIAALREAWKERDELRTREGQWWSD